MTINDKSIKSIELIMKLLTKNTATQAVKSFPNIYDGTKLIFGELLITVRLPPTKQHKGVHKNHRDID